MPIGPRHSGMLATTTCVWCVRAFSVVALLSASAAPATAVDVCVSMGSGGQVAGVQMDLAWDPTCMTADSGSGSTANCRAEPATRKTIATKVGSGTLRALFFSLADTSPIPDGTLYCCAFTTTGTSNADPCCSLRFANVSLSDPFGHRLGAEDADVQASVGGVQCATAAIGGSAAPPAAAPLPPGPVPPAEIVVPAAGSGAPQPPAGQAPAAPTPAGRAPASGGGIVTGSEAGTSGAPPAGAAEQAPVPGETGATTQFTATVPPHATRPAQRTPTRAGTPTMPARTPTGERTTSAPPGTPTGAPARTPAQ